MHGDLKEAIKANTHNCWSLSKQICQFPFDLFVQFHYCFTLEAHWRLKSLPVFRMVQKCSVYWMKNMAVMAILGCQFDCIWDEL